MNRAAGEGKVDFWTSPRIAKIISAHLDAEGIRPSSTQDLWQCLFSDIEKTYPPKGSRVAPDAWPRFRSHLFVVRDLVKEFRASLEEQYGPECWERVKQSLQDDDRARSCLRLIKQLAAIDRLDGVETLTRIGKKGFPYKLPNGDRRVFGGKGCGFDVIVAVSRQIEKALAHDTPQDRRDVAEKTSGPTGPIPRATIKLLGGNLLRVNFNGKSCELKDAPGRMLVFLKSQKETQTFETLWQFLHGKEEAYEPDRKGPPSSLRTLKGGLNKKLLDHLGPPPEGKEWVQAEKGRGYKFTTSVNFVLLAEGSENLHEFLRSPRHLDGQFDDDE